MNNACGHKECTQGYCLIKFYYEEHCQINDILNLKNSKHENWKNGRYLPEKKSLQFNGVALHLYPDGNYYLEDTTGG